MSTGWSLFVIVITLGMLIGFSWLILNTRRIQDPKGHGKLNDHEFDGITEYDAPMPDWFTWAFLASIVFAFIYLLLYPGFGNFPGLLGWTSAGALERDQQRAAARYEPIHDQFLEVPVEELMQDRAAMNMAARIFGNHCAQCHGDGGRGNFGFPDLTDGHWQWGGDVEQVRASIRDGRQAAMPGWQSALGERGIHDTTAYVLSLADRDHDADAASRGARHYQTFCAACHGPDGSGNVALGAPDLTLGIYLYGGGAQQIAFTLRHGRNGVMPAQKDEMSEAWIHLLTAYVLGLSEQDMP